MEVSRYKHTLDVHSLALHKHTNATQIQAKVYGLDLLITGKLNALFTRYAHPSLGGRRIIKGRDVYDFIFFGKGHQIDWKFIQDYSSTDPSVLVQKVTELMNLLPKFKEEIIEDIQDLLASDESFTEKDFAVFYENFKTLNFPEAIRKNVQAIISLTSPSSIE